MARFVQVYITDHRGQVERLGSDGVATLDGRWSLFTCHEEARHIATARGATAYQLRSGRYSNYHPISPVVSIERNK